MKKIALALALFAFGFANAQAPLEEGGFQLNGGFGATTYGASAYAGLEYGLMKDISIGGEISYQSYGATTAISGYGNDYNINAIGVQANGSYHFNELLQIPSKFDVYAGANVNYYSWSKNDYGVNSVGLGVHAGGRYFFTDNLGVNVQLGGGNVFSGVKVGITYKL